jgi:hypothetical protein
MQGLAVYPDLALSGSKRNASLCRGIEYRVTSVQYLVHANVITSRMIGAQFRVLNKNNSRKGSLWPTKFNGREEDIYATGDEGDTNLLNTNSISKRNKESV